MDNRYKFSEEELSYLLNEVYNGNKENLHKDIPMLEDVASTCDYFCYDNWNNKPTYLDTDDVKKRIGMEDFLSGISKVAYNGTCTKQDVYFDCTKMFK